MTPQLADGWLLYPCDADDSAQVQLVVGDVTIPAFRDSHDGTRVAKIRPPAEYVPRSRVALVVDGVQVSTGRV